MLFFGLTLAVGVLAVLGAQKLDIECVNPAPPKRLRIKTKSAGKSEAPGGYVPGAAFLRQQ
jgi:hypothetical protein